MIDSQVEMERGTATPSKTILLDDAVTIPTIAPVPGPNQIVSRASSQRLQRTFAGGIVRVWQPEAEPMTIRGFYHHTMGHIKCWLHDLKSVERWHERLELSLFSEIALWHAALVEFIGTFMFTFMVIVFATSILLHPQDYSYFPTAIALIHIPLIGLLILATASTSGGHLNSMITFCTFVVGMTEFPRMIMYITAQIVGSIAASYTAKYMLSSNAVHVGMLAMCSIGTEQTPAQALTMEIFVNVLLLLIAFGVALDERQRQVFPPWLPPFLIALFVATIIYTTPMLSAFGTGTIGYPSRCFGPAVAMDLVTAKSFTLSDGTVVNNEQWIYWIGPLISSLMVGALYRISPPGYVNELEAKRRSKARERTTLGDNNV